jgi:DDE family transposase
MPLVFFIITTLFQRIMLPLLPYMKCLLYGYNSLNNLCASGDQSFSINTQSCYDIHKLLERVGRAYRTRLVKILSIARAANLVRSVIDLSVDGLHMPYDGKKRVEDWGTPFSTMMNRAYPGLYPLTAVDLASGLILFAGSFVRAGAKECKKHLGNVVAPRVMECIELLNEAGITARSVIADEGITSHALMSGLVSRGIDYVLALRANSRLRRFEPWVKRWSKLDPRGRLIGMVRNVGYYKETTNLVIIKDAERTYLYISSISKWPRDVWERFCRRGNHERRHGVASTMGIKSLPSNGLFQIEGHVLVCVYLNLILKSVCREFNLGEIDVETLRSMFTRQCYIRWQKDGKMHATIIASKSLLKKLGSRRITKWDRGSIEFIYYRERNAPKIPDNL